ncbi:MAG TPA: hypothetical protein PLF40_28060 [Kofleriaceae bacterium]|nr:hypothetical protein [Kofleriaceae bacterium]
MTATRLGHVFLLLIVAISIGCRRGDKAKCEKAVRNVFTLTFWHTAEKQIAALPEDQRLAKRRELEQKFDAKIKLELDRIASQCVAADDDDRADCMIKADTCAKAKACMPDDTNVDISKECD